MVDDNSKSLFLQLENLLDNHSLDYIDIAGGCNLKAADFQTSSSIEGLLAQQNYSNTHQCSVYSF